MSDDKWIFGGLFLALLAFIGAVIAMAAHSANLRQECLIANYQRSAGDVIAICGKP